MLFAERYSGFVFQKTEELQLSKNQLLGELEKLGTEYSITFQLFLTSAKDGNIIHFTIGGNIGRHGNRSPGLWAAKGKFYLASSIDGNHNYSFQPPLPSLNTWHSIEISQLSRGSEVFQKYILICC